MYQMIKNDNGTYSFIDVTDYTQEGDLFGANDINATNAAVNRLNCVKSITLPVSGWSSVFPYTQTVQVSGITANDIPTPGIIYPSGCTRARQKEITKAAGYIYEIETGNGTVTVRCTEKPTAEFTLGLKGV